MNEWIATRAAALGAAELTDDEQETILDLARIAAHESGDRTNAPLLCYLLGRAQGERSLAETAEIVRSTS
jgi:uncharacterized protein DUF6457